MPLAVRPGSSRGAKVVVHSMHDFPVEVHMKNPRAAGGVRGAEKWRHWHEPRALATLSVAVCEEKGKGLEMKAWRDDFEFLADCT